MKDWAKIITANQGRISLIFLNSVDRMSYLTNATYLAKLGNQLRVEKRLRQRLTLLLIVYC